MNFYSKTDVAKHNKINDCWIIIHNYVYDVTDYLKNHPGGKKLIFRSGGGDATQDFDGMFHSIKAQRILKELKVGELIKTDHRKKIKSNLLLAPSSINVRPPLQKSNNLNVSSENKRPQHILKSIKQLNNSVKLFTFEPGFDYTVIHHINIIVKNKEGQNIKRSYTPLESLSNKVRLAIKIYEHGIASQYLNNLNVGDKLSFSGPFITFRYRPNRFTHIGMIAAGTGITPMLQLANTIRKNKKDNASLYLLNVNRTESDLILEDEIKEMKRIESTNLYTSIDGRIDQNLIEKTMPQPKLLFVGHGSYNPYILISGPQGFCDYVTELLQSLKYNFNEYFVMGD